MSAALQEAVLFPMVKAFLSDSASHGQAGAVQVLETHCAVVFLTEDLVYKLKKPVTFGLLDFSTCDKRREAVEAELRLNRRAAPEIYLETRAIHRTPDGRLAFGEDGDVVDWVVVMRRFDQQDILINRFSEGQGIEDGQIADLADAIVELQDKAEIAPAGFGGAEGLRQISRMNLDLIAGQAGQFGAAEAARLRDQLGAAVVSVSELLDRRRDEGAVRHCHGDLHLGNIVLWQGKPIPFDCIEYSPVLSCVDRVFDLAFLLMDLDVRGHRRAANLLFNRYFGRVGDVTVLQALPAMLATQAAVRTAVTAFQASSTEAGPVQDELWQVAREKLGIALAFLKPRAPRMVVVGGLSGTGKSTLARELAPDLGVSPGALHLRSDVLRKRLWGLRPEGTLPREAFTQEASDRVYCQLYREAREALKAGHSVVIDAVFAKQSERKRVAQVAAESGATFSGIWLDLPVEVREGRVEGRRNDASDADRRVVQEQEGYDLREITWSRTDASGTPEAVLRKVHELI